jgi:uncharacterized protein YgfB (UPF0149 family)
MNQTVPQDVPYEILADALARLGYPQDAAEYHGALCGALCVRSPGDIDLLKLLDVAPGHTLRRSAEAETVLKALLDKLENQLHDDELTFAPLLPDDDTALMARVQALIAWCEGFLFGIATRKGLDLKNCSAEAREAVQDITEFTRATLADGDDAELEEQAYTELVEYLRIAAQVLFMEFRAGERVPPPTVH